MFNLKVVVFVITAFLCLKVQALPGPTSGAGTIKDISINAFGFPLFGVTKLENREFFVGNSFFKEAWVEAPSSTVGRDGLGPTFNAVSCSSCHGRDGRGPGYLGPERDSLHVSLLFRLSQRNLDGTFSPHPIYGSQLNPFGIANIPGEGHPRVAWKSSSFTFPDGERAELLEPQFDFSTLTFGALGKMDRFSPRLASQVIGLGLVENITDGDIVRGEDPQDLDQDGISGRAAWLSPNKTPGTLGRFGWKAAEPSLAAQNAAAFNGDLGLTTSLFPEANCPAPQLSCLEAPNGGAPEVTDLQLQRITTYTQLLAAPLQRFNAESEKGEALFHQVSCQKCHTPNWQTGNSSPYPILNRQSIWPYSDFLLHDMGMELVDHRPEGAAGGREWRTPPLWGLGLIPIVNSHSNLLHDGRARSVQEAILWHSGEAAASREAYTRLSRNERRLLIQFVESL